MPYIKREALIEKISSITVIIMGVRSGKTLFNEALKSYREAVLKNIKEAPTADVVEVVRCAKCRYFFDECCNHPKNRVAHRVPDFGTHYSYAEGIKVEPNHFCGYGERTEQAIHKD